MSDYKGLFYMRYKLESKRARNVLRYDYYEMKNAQQDFNITMPEHFRWLNECLGWCAKSVDTLADRLSFREFKNYHF